MIVSFLGYFGFDRDVLGFNLLLSNVSAEFPIFFLQYATMEHQLRCCCDGSRWNLHGLGSYLLGM